MKKVYLMFAAFGLLILALGIYNFTNELGFKSRELITNGIVIKINVKSHHSRKGSDYITKTPVVSYTSKDGKKNISEAADYREKHDYSIGENVKIFYDPSNPGIAKLKHSFGSSIILIIIGLAILVIVFKIYQREVRKEKASKLLMQTGIKIAADLVSIDHEIGPIVMGKTPFTIKCQWFQPQNNKTYTFKSKHIWFNPTAFMGERKQLDVFINPRDPEKYYMDISFLPKRGK